MWVTERFAVGCWEEGGRKDRVRWPSSSKRLAVTTARVRPARLAQIGGTMWMGWDGMGWKRWGKAGGGWRSDRSSHRTREGRGYGASLGGFGADGWLRYQSIAYLNRAVRSGVLEMVHRTTGVAAPDELVDDSVACTKYNTYLPGAVLKLVGSFQLVEVWWRCAETNDDRGSSWAATAATAPVAGPGPASET